MSGEHETVPVQVWADIDEGIAPLVRYLNTIPGVRTHASCQGSIGEGGAEPYGPYVLASYQTDEAEIRLRHEFDCTEVFMSTARVHPREGWTAPEEICKECGGVPCRLGNLGSDNSGPSPAIAAARPEPIFGKIVRVDNERFRGFGFATADSLLRKRVISVLLENGNVWDYDASTVRLATPDEILLAPKMIKKFAPPDGQGAK